MNFKKILVVLSLCVINFFITIQVTAQEKTPTVHMTITPSVCVVKVRGDLCQMTANVSWQANLPISACLYKNDDLIKCWKQEQSIQEKLTLSLTQNMVFTLQNKHKILNEQYIKVNASTSTKYRRRLRSQWSLF